MGFDSTDHYEQAKLTAKQYGKLKLDILCAYDLHRQALKELLDIVQPITRQRIEQRQHGQSPSTIFCNAVKEFLDGEQGDRYKYIPNLFSDLHELVVVMSNPEDNNILVMEDYWSVSHVTEEKFNQYWPKRSGKTTRLEVPSQSSGIWKFDDQNHTIQLHVASDWQGDQWGLDNNMTRIFRAFVRDVQNNDQWTKSTGAVYFSVYHEGFTNITDVFGNPENPDPFQYDDKEWEAKKTSIKQEHAKDQAQDLSMSEFADEQPL